MELDGVRAFRGPMCGWELPPLPSSYPGRGWLAYVQKETVWLANRPRPGQILEASHANSRPDFGMWHRHVHLIEDIPKCASVYPPKFVTALKEQLQEDGALESL